ncbi:alpha/beta hydrolase [Blautia schinkii]|nr:alpha/beta hydrolase [Blautia schinkii]
MVNGKMRTKEVNKGRAKERDTGCTPRRNKRRILLIGLLAVVLFLAGGIVYYVNDYYRSDVDLSEYLQDSGSVKVIEIKEGLFLDGPGSESALVFYPGAKVEYTSYLPILYNLSEQGTDVFLTKMPFNLAFLGKNKVSDIMADYDYESWYLGGHSLGGAMAAAYAADHPGELDGLVLLAAYPTKKLPTEDFSVLSIYGSEDGVLNMEKVEKGREYMPADYEEFFIEGGNHAQFGDYGAQKGDGKAAISRNEQQAKTVEAIYRMIHAASSIQS